MVRSIEHLPNTPRQVFIYRALGADLPNFAHLPYVAEPGGQKKLSKRKIASYLKNRDFKLLYDEGVAIASQIGVEPTPESFNPVLVEFYQAVGYRPEAILNALLLLGWSLDDKTENFTIDEMIKCFSLERVVKSPASFDPQKLTAFEGRAMSRQSLDQRLEMVIPFAVRAGWLDESDTMAREMLRQVVAAADQRLVVAGNILNYRDFFVADAELPMDEEAFDKRIRRPSEAARLLGELRVVLADTLDFTVEALENLLARFVEQRQIKINQVIHALRVALTGKSIGFGMFETMNILGRERCLNRIDSALQRLEASTRAK